MARVQDPDLRFDYKETVLARLIDPLEVIAILNGGNVA